MSDDAGFFKKTSEAVANAGASVAGAVSGSLSLGANASHKKTTTTKTKTSLPAAQDQQYYIANGGAAGQPPQGRITDGGLGEQKRITSKETDALYKERMEDEYAKREGGA
ncbi:uncharacterized protein Z520_06216 [Fonsecaea multimorphosa CBS 102226]|uniref:Uncharacterized protein n=1 Tax=Fonsecaea multimorphosa CBS 102226 TaxID=1442371 RepID=A0A0D2IM83_9EURO|nr:uncharacterized protein Z520_06216 [Fonsecaea multimorphosa CBS 102226]KIX98136.1 hypothetical protein Z520_06216 [Fonsecaea multimorphosa CBS 102226]OAL24211.1 hypothetical protein AYO22_05871 [Fonsecaea multimorphosa]